MGETKDQKTIVNTYGKMDPKSMVSVFSSHNFITSNFIPMKFPQLRTLASIV